MTETTSRIKAIAKAMNLQQAPEKLHIQWRLPGELCEWHTPSGEVEKIPLEEFKARGGISYGDIVEK